MKKTDLKLKQLISLLLRLEVLNCFQQDVNSFCIADTLEAGLCNMLQPSFDFRIAVPIHLCGGKEVQISSAHNSATLRVKLQQS